MLTSVAIIQRQSAIQSNWHREKNRRDVFKSQAVKFYLISQLARGEFSYFQFVSPKQLEVLLFYGVQIKVI